MNNHWRAIMIVNNHWRAIMIVNVFKFTNKAGQKLWYIPGCLEEWAVGQFLFGLEKKISPKIFSWQRASFTITVGWGGREGWEAIWGYWRELLKALKTKNIVAESCILLEIEVRKYRSNIKGTVFRLSILHCAHAVPKIFWIST